MWDSDYLMQKWKTSGKHIYNRRDMIIFALGIGCTNLKYIYENDPEFQVFPTMPFTLLFKSLSHDIEYYKREGNVKDPKNHFKLPALPDGGTFIDAFRTLEIVKPLSSKGDTVTSTLKLLSIQQKKNGAFFERGIDIRSSNNELLYRTVSGVYISKVQGLKDKGEPRFKRIAIPSSAPDWVLRERVGDFQHALFRLSGDYNPLHIDTNFAKAVGFEKPILHGLCTFGICVRVVLGKYSGEKVRKLGVRFTSPVLPGQVLEIHGWKCSSLRTTFLAMVSDRKVLEGFIEFFGSRL